MSRLAPLFTRLKAEHRTALIPYITAGDPAPSYTLELMHALVEGGADVIELGVPFSDPMADGPVIALAHERALAHGVGLQDVLSMVRAFRATNQHTPVVLMGYQNPIEARGVEVFARLAADSGVDGVLTVDLPPEEAESTAAVYRAVDIDPIFLMAPTTKPERVRLIAQMASGFVYYVSLKGVTGAQNLDVDALADRLTTIRSDCRLPVGVGFGIRNEATARAVSHVADAVIMGSALVQMIADHPVLTQPSDTLLTEVRAFISGIRHALDASVSTQV